MFGRISSRLAILAAMLGASVGMGSLGDTLRVNPTPTPRRQRGLARARYKGNTSTFFKVRCGARECARRRWQMYGRQIDRDSYLGPRHC